MKIGILSDNHRRLDLAKEMLEKLIQEGAEFIVHAGDMVSVEMLEMLENSPLKYVAVYGNNDAHLVQYQNEYNLVKEPYYFKIANTKFKLMHLPFYMAPDSDVVIFGHTHIFASEFKNETLFLNPGEVCAREKPLSESAMLEISDDRYEVSYYSKSTQPQTDGYEVQKFSYEKNNHK